MYSERIISSLKPYETVKMEDADRNKVKWGTQQGNVCILKPSSIKGLTCAIQYSSYRWLLKFNFFLKLTPQSH